MTAATPLRSRRPGLALLLGSLWGSLGCSEGARPADREPADAAAPFVVAATTEPLAWMAERLLALESGDQDGRQAAARVVRPLADAGDPAFASPDRAALEAFLAADLIVANGAGLERWLAHANLPASRLVRTADRLSAGLIRREEIVHRHGPEGEHTHGAVDPHTWLDPCNALEQARAVRDALATRLPAALGERLSANASALERDLTALDRELEALAPRLAAARVLAAHPSYEYAARRYGFEVANLDLDPDAALDQASFEALASALASAAGEGPALLLWEAAPLSATRERLASELGLASVVWSPGERPDPAGRDWLAAQRADLAALAAALGP